MPKKIKNMFIFLFLHLKNMGICQIKILMNLLLDPELKFLNTKKTHLILFYGNLQMILIQDGTHHGAEDDQDGTWNVLL